MKIFFASDHAGYNLKKHLISYVQGLGYETEDKGDFTSDPQDDYPLFISLVGKEVSCQPSERGIVIGGSGQGEAIVANRYKNVRAIVWYGGDMEIIKLAREHNDSNVLALGARFVSDREAEDAVKIWLTTNFTFDERHKRRITEIDTLTDK